MIIQCLQPTDRQSVCESWICEWKKIFKLKLPDQNSPPINSRYVKGNLGFVSEKEHSKLITADQNSPPINGRYVNPVIEHSE